MLDVNRGREQRSILGDLRYLASTQRTDTQEQGQAMWCVVREGNVDKQGDALKRLSCWSLC